ncbi:MAG: CoA-transferase [Sulfolobales archaeon]
MGVAVMELRKIVDPHEALSAIRDGSVVAVSGFNMIATPAYLLLKLYELYEQTGHPRDLFIIAETCPGTPGRGLDAIGRKMIENMDYGFLRGVLIPYYGWVPNISKLVEENLIEGYNWPIGVVSHWFREVAAGRPGLITKVGLNTMFDPRLEGGFLNDLAARRRTCKVEVVAIAGEEMLLYSCPKPTAALIRATTADEEGNLSMEHESAVLNVLSIAQAARSSPERGIVVAQVKRVTKFRSIKPREVHVPGPLVNYVVVSPELPEYHGQTFSVLYDPTLSGELTPPAEVSRTSVLPMGTRKIIARRVAIELVRLVADMGRPILVNLGIGVPAEVASVLAEEEVEDFVYTTVESGPFGGIALTGPDFGASRGFFALIPMADMFSLYEGGIIDAASLGFLQVDPQGNVNSAFLPGRMPGAGGFPVIAFGAPNLLFAGEFTAGNRQVRASSNGLEIIKDGDVIKFVGKVYKVVYSGPHGVSRGQNVLFITERAVFRLTEGGLELVEVAPGVDIDKHILSKMEFKPKISKNLREMSKELFNEKPIGLRNTILSSLRK